MSDIAMRIRKEIESDVTIKVKGLGVEVFSKGFPRRRTFVRLLGHAPSAHDRDRVEQIAHHHCGDVYTVVDEIQLVE